MWVPGSIAYGNIFSGKCKFSGPLPDLQNQKNLRSRVSSLCFTSPSPAPQHQVLLMLT